MAFFITLPKLRERKVPNNPINTLYPRNIYLTVPLKVV
jgi:hypothetical protein